MAQKKITGKVSYQKIGPGFWGIIGNNGKEWRPVNMPEQLKYEGKRVSVVVKEMEEDVSVFMWGTPVRIVSFSTLMP